MIIKAAGRFLTALFIAVALGMGLYLAMHFIVQPIADQLDPVTPREENQSAQTENDVSDQPEKDVQSFDAGQFTRRLLSIAKNGAVFVLMTVIVFGFRSYLKKSPPPFFQK